LGEHLDVVLLAYFTTGHLAFFSSRCSNGNCALAWSPTRAPVVAWSKRWCEKGHKQYEWLLPLREALASVIQGKGPKNG
jgi:hypothetical protein